MNIALLGYGTVGQGVDELLKNGFVAGRPSSGLTVSELPAAYAA